MTDMDAVRLRHIWVECANISFQEPAKWKIANGHWQWAKDWSAWEAPD